MPGFFPLLLDFFVSFSIMPVLSASSFARSNGTIASVCPLGRKHLCFRAFHPPLIDSVHPRFALLMTLLYLDRFGSASKNLPKPLCVVVRVFLIRARCEGMISSKTDLLNKPTQRFYRILVLPPSRWGADVSFARW